MYKLDNFIDAEMDILIDVEQGRKDGAGIDYENPQEVAELVSKHLAKIFIATFKKKIEQEIEDVKRRRKGEQLKLF